MMREIRYLTNRDIAKQVVLPRIELIEKKSEYSGLEHF
jgi:hypothetical protein